MAESKGRAALTEGEKSLLSRINMAKVPKHVAIIMDGNGRWAQRKGLPRVEGHRAGINSVKATVEIADEIGVQFLSLYAFSMENWRRPKTEIRALFSLLSRYLDDEFKTMMESKMRFKSLGHIHDLPSAIHRKIKKIEDATASHEGMTLNLCLSYGGRTEIMDACQSLVNEAVGKGVKMKITPGMIEDRLYTRGQPDPDLLVRTSGEMRVSNFLLWQIAYSEMYVTPVFWPDFGKADFLEALLDYQRRERRYGGVETGEALK